MSLEHRMKTSNMYLTPEGGNIKKWRRGKRDDDWEFSQAGIKHHPIDSGSLVSLKPVNEKKKYLKYITVKLPTTKDK